MDKNSIIIILKECFETEGNCAYLHFVDGSNLLIYHLPIFNNLHMQIQNDYSVWSEKVSEIICIPYTSVIYITLTNSENLRIINEQYKMIKSE